MDVIERNILNNDLYFILSLISFLFIALLRGFYWKFTKLLLKGTVDRRFANQYLREENVFTERVNILTFILILINFSLFFFKITQEDVSNKFFLIVVIISIYYILKYAFILLLGKVFLLESASQLAWFFSMLYDRSLSIIIFPFIVLIYFSSIPIVEFLIYFTCLFFLFFQILKVAFIWRIGSTNFHFSSIYIFLYLCILEVFPFLYVGKIIMR